MLFISFNGQNHEKNNNISPDVIQFKEDIKILHSFFLMLYQIREAI